MFYVIYLTFQVMAKAEIENGPGTFPANQMAPPGQSQPMGDQNQYGSQPMASDQFNQQPMDGMMQQQQFPQDGMQQQFPQMGQQNGMQQQFPQDGMQQQQFPQMGPQDGMQQQQFPQQFSQDGMQQQQSV